MTCFQAALYYFVNCLRKPITKIFCRNFLQLFTSRQVALTLNGRVNVVSSVRTAITSVQKCVLKISRAILRQLRNVLSNTQNITDLFQLIASTVFSENVTQKLLDGERNVFDFTLYFKSKYFGQEKNQVGRLTVWLCQQSGKELLTGMS